MNLYRRRCSTNTSLNNESRFYFSSVLFGFTRSYEGKDTFMYRAACQGTRRPRTEKRNSIDAINGIPTARYLRLNLLSYSICARLGSQFHQPSLFQRANNISGIYFPNKPPRFRWLPRFARDVLSTNP